MVSPKAQVTVSLGQKDALFLRHHQDALAAGIADARLVIYSGTGHAVHWEEPERFAADLVRFVGDGSRTR
ncbi:MAG: alpha/beta fold hydrolase [Vicinamibacteria bacterium]